MMGLVLAEERDHEELRDEAEAVDALADRQLALTGGAIEPVGDGARPEGACDQCVVLQRYSVITGHPHDAATVPDDPPDLRRGPLGLEFRQPDPRAELTRTHCREHQ